MGFFSSNTIFDEDVDKATNECNTTEDWGLYMKICDKVKSNPDRHDEFCAVVLRKANHKVPHVCIQALNVLDACVNNCGMEFKKEIASQDFINELRTIIYKGHPKVSDKLKGYVRKWSEEFKDDAHLSRLTSFYHFLRSEGIEFPKEEETKPVVQLTTNPDAVSSQQEADDIAKAIELSLKAETQTKTFSPSAYQLPTTTSALYPSVQGSSTGGSAPPMKTVKAIYDFEAAEDNELTFKAGDIISILDDSDANWWKGQGSNGTGLFPANFVTSDLSVEPEPDFGVSKAATSQEESTDDRAVSFNDEVEVKEVNQAEPVLEINEELMDRTLLTLQNTDPENSSKDPAELLQDEQSCIQMNPLIDNKLEAVDRKHLEYTQLNEKILEALNMYDKLMNESYAFPTVPAYMSQQVPHQNFPQQQQAQQYMGNPQYAGMYQPSMNPSYTVPQQTVQALPPMTNGQSQSYPVTYSQQVTNQMPGTNTFSPQHQQHYQMQATPPMQQPLM